MSEVRRISPEALKTIASPEKIATSILKTFCEEIEEKFRDVDIDYMRSAESFGYLEDMLSNRLTDVALKPYARRQDIVPEKIREQITTVRNLVLENLTSYLIQEIESADTEFRATFLKEVLHIIHPETPVRI